MEGVFGVGKCAGLGAGRNLTKHVDLRASECAAGASAMPHRGGEAADNEAVRVASDQLGAVGQECVNGVDGAQAGLDGEPPAVGVAGLGCVAVLWKHNTPERGQARRVGADRG